MVTIVNFRISNMNQELFLETDKNRHFIEHGFLWMYIKRVLNSSLKHFQTLRKTDKNLITFVVTELILKILLKVFFYQTLAY